MMYPSCHQNLGSPVECIILSVGIGTEQNVSLEKLISQTTPRFIPLHDVLLLESFSIRTKNAETGPPWHQAKQKLHVALGRTLVPPTL